LNIEDSEFWIFDIFNTFLTYKSPQFNKPYPKFQYKNSLRLEDEWDFEYAEDWEFAKITIENPLSIQKFNYKLFKNYNDSFKNKINKFSKFKKDYINYKKEFNKKYNKNYLKKNLNKRFKLLILFKFYLNNSSNVFNYGYKIKNFDKEIFLKYLIKNFNYKYKNKFKNFNKIFLNKFYYWLIKYKNRHIKNFW
jgi:hypothetical protein